MVLYKIKSNQGNKTKTHLIVSTTQIRLAQNATVIFLVQNLQHSASALECSTIKLNLVAEICISKSQMLPVVRLNVFQSNHFISDSRNRDVHAFAHCVHPGLRSLQPGHHRPLQRILTGELRSPALQHHILAILADVWRAAARKVNRWRLKLIYQI